ncbi:hypothetical protein [Synechocystis sp. PCC 7509]|uniref:hypothetical protein n=1 Tax=Synechocystis sp. PCC 7509 TaxID=927677 RepID=UPI0002ABC78E|nr:hypothetical protein [Synechocystis sp. PCC 7509]
MASEQEVKQYLAYWFQLGKKVVIADSGKALLPQPIMQGEDFSQAFEECWQQITSCDAIDSYLAGTQETIRELLTDTWQVMPCARCTMPVPFVDAGMLPLECPCKDLDNWPNWELPTPRLPVNSQAKLSDICDRLENQTWGS